MITQKYLDELTYEVVGASIEVYNRGVGSQKNKFFNRGENACNL